MVKYKFAIKKLVREEVLRKEGFVVRSISLNTHKRKSLREKNVGSPQKDLLR